MNDEQALLNAIKADRDDDAPRLVYADWLMENGQEEKGEFIAWMVRNPGFQCRWLCPMDVIAELRPNPPGSPINAGRGMWHLPVEMSGKWLIDGYDGMKGWFIKYASGCLLGRSNWTWVWRRGFVEEVGNLTSLHWLNNCETLEDECVLKKVKLTSRMLYSGNGGPENPPSLYSSEHVIEAGPWSSGTLRYECKRAITPRMKGPHGYIADIIKQEWPHIQIEMPPEPVPIDQRAIDFARLVRPEWLTDPTNLSRGIWEESGRRIAEAFERQVIHGDAPQPSVSVSSQIIINPPE